MEPVKGSATSEFIIAILAHVIPLLVLVIATVWDDTHWLVGALTAVGTAIGAGVASAGYSSSRAKVKAAYPQAYAARGPVDRGSTTIDPTHSTHR